MVAGDGVKKSGGRTTGQRERPTKGETVGGRPGGVDNDRGDEGDEGNTQRTGRCEGGMVAIRMTATAGCPRGSSSGSGRRAGEAGRPRQTRTSTPTAEGDAGPRWQTQRPRRYLKNLGPGTHTSRGPPLNNCDADHRLQKTDGCANSERSAASWRGERGFAILEYRNNFLARICVRVQ